MSGRKRPGQWHIIKVAEAEATTHKRNSIIETCFWGLVADRVMVTGTIH